MNKIIMKPEQERVRHLLTDTVTLLCKNGLQFQEELKIEGVIGITIDNNEVFVVHVNEAFGAGGVEKGAPKSLGGGEVNATTLAELPGLVSPSPMRGRMPAMRASSVNRPVRGGVRGRPFAGGLRRGTLGNKRGTMGRSTFTQGRGRGMSANRPSIPMPQSNVSTQPLPNLASPQRLKTENLNQSNDFNKSPPPYLQVKQEHETPKKNLEPNMNNDMNNSKNSFVNLTLDDIASDNLSFFDPINESVDNPSLEAPAKRQRTDSHSNLSTSIDSMLNIVSSGSIPNNPAAHPLPSSLSSQVKQEPALSDSCSKMSHSFPQMIDSISGVPNWPPMSPDKSHANMSNNPDANLETDVIVKDVTDEECDVQTNNPQSPQLSSYQSSEPHPQKSSLQQQWPCPYCSKKFRLKRDMTKHLYESHGSKHQERCEHCDKLFNSRSGLALHMASHSGNKPYVCPLCNKGFTQKDHYNGHMNKHAGAKPFQCLNCLKCFSYSSHLCRHKKLCSGAIENVN